MQGTRERQGKSRSYRTGRCTGLEHRSSDAFNRDNRSSSLPAVTPATNAPNTAPTSVPAFDPESGNTTGKSKPVLTESPIGNTIASGPNLERGDIANDIFRKTSTAASNATKIEVVNMRADKEVEQAFKKLVDLFKGDVVAAVKVVTIQPDVITYINTKPGLRNPNPNR